ncbi:Glycosyl transferase family 2 [Verrucomicrobia bacterium]|nr:Glycosyl transferase family 2 [Verrucomicrobiota bacterium]
MNSRIITTIPVFNGEEFILQTLQSLAAQTRRPDRVVVLDNCSTDRTEAIVKGFEPLRCEWSRNPTNLGVFGNFNRCLDFAEEADYLHILHADDLIEPEFYQVMTALLEDCSGLALGWCLDERIDEQNRRLSLSGKPDGKVDTIAKDDFLKRKAEISNQAFAATLLKTSRRPAPCRFPMDMPILGDAVFWARFGQHCDKLVHIHRLLAKYRWHGTNSTHVAAPSLQALVLDEWRTMELNEALRGSAPGFVRWFKLKGLLAVRSGIKAKRFRQMGNLDYSRQIVQAIRPISGPLPWFLGQVLVETRDLAIYTIGRRPRHPKNVYG